MMYIPYLAALCMKWVVPVSLLLLSFFVWREPCLALASLSATGLGWNKYSMAVIMDTVLYFIVRDGHHVEWWAFAAYHGIVCITVLSEYVVREIRWVCWCGLFWSIKWLGYVPPSGPRGALRCVVFLLVCRSHQTWCRVSTRELFRWSWLLYSHECAWVCVPIQMLYEVYRVPILPT